ncbi:MAG: C4-dicarboxylate transporter [Rubritepida sp.]|nr:C4-dicarboxylate transporter [Rubritepida sp.]
MRLLICSVILSVWSLFPTAQAQTFPVPGRSITFIYGFPPGTPGDVYLRLMAPRLSAALGVPVTVENRIGATGNLSMEAVARSAPDGHTVLLGTSAMLAINPAIFPRMPVDAEKELASVMRIFDAPNVLTVSAVQRPQFTDCQALMSAIRAAPGRLNYASSGIGASTHLAAAQFLQAAGLEMVHVPYRGGPPAMIALYQGDVDIFFYQSGTVLDDWRSGRVRILGITSAERHPQVPEIPTIAEACNLPGFVSTTWHGLMVPAATPAATIERLRLEVAKVNEMPDIQSRLINLGLTPLRGGPAEMRAAIAYDIPHWAEIVRRSGARME